MKKVGCCYGNSQYPGSEEEKLKKKTKRKKVFWEIREVRFGER
jgi:hypothetical protein